MKSAPETLTSEKLPGALFECVCSLLFKITADLAVTEKIFKEA